MPDVATRVAQMETGELDFADDLNIDAYDRLQKSANARPVVAKPYYWLVAVLNKKEGLMTNQKLRQAWQAAIDIEPIMKAVAGGRSEFYRMDASLAFVENAPWYVKPQAAWGWNERNKEKAKRLLQEAGYKGEPVRFLTTQEYKWMYNFALVTKQQLEDVGFKIDLQVVDWATLSSAATTRRSTTPSPPGPATSSSRPAFTALSCHLAGLDLRRGHPGPAAGDDPRRPIRRSASRSGSRCTGSGTRRCRRSATETSTGSGAASKKLQGFNEKTERPRFYNVWLDRSARLPATP